MEFTEFDYLLHFQAVEIQATTNELLWSGLITFVMMWKIGIPPSFSFCYPTMTELAEQIEYIADHFQYVNW